MVKSRKVLLTTSRNPTPRMRTLCKDLARMILGVVSVNRGKMSSDEVAERALECEADRVVIVDRGQGAAGAVRFFRVDESGLVSVSPIIHVADVRLQREFGELKVKPALSLVLLASEASGEALRTAEAFSEFFGVPVVSMGEAVKAGSSLMCVSRDYVNRIVATFMVEPDHVEVGPRITVSSVEW